MRDTDPLRWRVPDLIAAYRRRELSPVEVTESALARVAVADDALHAFLGRTDELAREQARAATDAYLRGDVAPLAGVPVTIKDTFHIAGHVTTLGSLLHQHDVAPRDSGVVRRLRAAGAVFVGKTNTAEFGQSATTDNRLRPDCRNPWDPTRTPGGSSGGAAASVAAGVVPLAVGSDGGGSIRIPASFTGVFGIKPTARLCPDEDGFVAMADFVAPGPLARHVGDARLMLGVLADTAFPNGPRRRQLRIGYCARPLGHPVAPAVAAVIERTAALAHELGYAVDAVDLPLHGWDDIFGPLVLDDEARNRSHLLPAHADQLTEYERRTLEAAAGADARDVAAARAALPRFRAKVAACFEHYDLLLTPATATTAFPLGDRPRSVDGERVSGLWGAFPFSVPFNVAGIPAASLPAGIVDELPVGVQLVAAAGQERRIFEVAERLEQSLGFDRSAVDARWGDVAPARTP